MPSPRYSSCSWPGNGLYVLWACPCQVRWLFVTLLLMGRLPAGLRQTADHVLPHLMFLFIPAVAGVTLHFERLQQEWLPFVLACTLGTAITVAVTAATFCWVLKRTQKG